MTQRLQYNDAIDYIMSALPMFQRVGGAAYKANLDNTIEWLRYLGNPQNKFRSVHVAGTNGKGSVSHCLASIFQEAGYKTGLYTSPHLTDFRERIRINGVMIDKTYVAKFIEKHKAFLEKLKPSFFEMAVGLCFQYFADRKIDIAIVETGMGGRLDSTNVITPELSVITNIGFDHTLFLGDTLGQIAAEKAGIIKHGVPVVIGETQKETKPVFIKTAKDNQSQIIFADQVLKSEAVSHSLIPPQLTLRIFTKEHEYVIHSPLAGSYQIKNLQTVFISALTLRESGYKLSMQHIRSGIRKVTKATGLRGRWTVFGNKPAVIMDTAHNAAGLTYVAEMLNSLSYSRLHMVIGMVDDKNHEAMLKLLPQKAIYYLCKPSVPRGFDADKLRAIAIKSSRTGNSYDSVETAVRAAISVASQDDIIYIGGSTFTVADALAMKEFSE